MTKSCKDCIHLDVCHMWFASEHSLEEKEYFISRNIAEEMVNDDGTIGCEWYREESQ